MQFRPGTELLEARDVPALCVWTGAVSTAFSNPLNWSGGVVPQAGDDIWFGPEIAVGVTPIGEGSEGFAEAEPETPAIPIGGGDSGGSPGGGSPTWQDCYGLVAASGGAYHSVTLAKLYTGTVTATSAFTTEIFELHGGTIDPSSSGYDITVTGSFSWTGGTLNSTSNAAMLSILGDGTIAPIDSGTLTTGNSIQVLGHRLYQQRYPSCLERLFLTMQLRELSEGMRP